MSSAGGLSAGVSEATAADEPPSPVLTSLAYNRQSVARCPRKLGWRYVNRATGEIVPARCGANRCGHCGPINARLTAGAIGLAAPERAVLLTSLGSEWPTIRNRLKHLSWAVRGAGLEWHAVYHVEPNPRGTGHHAHVWQRGDYVPQALLADLCRHEGLGFPWINALRVDPRAGLSYGLKLAGIGYGLKLAESTDSMAVYLAANGNRLAHATRGFWRDENGEPVPGVKEARKAALRGSTGRTDDVEPDQWELRREEA